MKTGLIATGCFALILAGGRLLAADKAGDPAKGKEVFEQCGVCHNADSEEKGEKMGPGLKGLYKRAKLKNGKKVTDENVKAIINTGGQGMPPFADMLSDEERANVLAYVKTL
jgi:cytochrome c